MTLLLPPKSFSYFATQQNDHIICYNNKRLLHSFNPSFHTIQFEYNTKKKDNKIKPFVFCLFNVNIEQNGFIFPHASFQKGYEN